MSRKISTMQAMLDGISAQWQRERAETHLTLGGLIASLEALPRTDLVSGITNPHSYRGYYEDLAFEPASESMLAEDALQVAKDCMGKVFEGYKGGEYGMSANTPIWLSRRGETGEKIIGIDAKTGLLELQPDGW